MRIISKQHDYYDTAMGLGRDTSVRYKRNRNELAAAPEPVAAVMKPMTHRFHYDPVEARGTYFSFAPFLVAFCGKLYRGIKVERLYRTSTRVTGFTSESTVFYDWESLSALLAKYRATLPATTHYHKKQPLERQIRDHLAAQGTLELQQYLHDERIVILTCFEVDGRFWTNGELVAFSYAQPAYKVVIDDALGDLGFGRFFDAYSAYQEIDMYLSGVLGADSPPMAVLPETDRVAQHGFDKWSFRRQPEPPR